MRDHEKRGEKHGHLHFGHHEWVFLDGKVLERRILHPQRSAPHAKLFVVRLEPPEDDRNNLTVMISATDAMAAELKKDVDDDY